MWEVWSYEQEHLTLNMEIALINGNICGTSGRIWYMWDDGYGMDIGEGRSLKVCKRREVVADLRCSKGAQV